jgi:choline dehydrogenase
MQYNLSNLVKGHWRDIVTYDYIVIGAGSAGCMIAARLSEREDLSVLLLEAGGPDEQADIHIPLKWRSLMNTPLDWAYQTTPQVNCNNRVVKMPRGKVYGGSSSTNAMIYQRGNPADYDGWAELGNEGWAWDDVLPYFKKSQYQEHGKSDAHGVDGALHISDLLEPNPLSIAFVEAAQQAGFSKNDDFNDGEQEGFGLHQVTQKNGERQSTAVTYLRPALKRNNLNAIPFAMVTQLTFEGTRCTGAVYVKDGEEHNVTASKEVILCGGAINSPQLLMLSGIGNKAQLEALNIDTVKDLPGVGKNLQDHIRVFVSHYSKEPVSLILGNDEAQAEKYNAEKRGLLTSNIGEAAGFVKLDPQSHAPELQFIFLPLLDHLDDPETHGFKVGPGLATTKSVGELTLQSTDPYDPPLINPNYLDKEHDMNVLVEGVKLARKIFNSPAFDKYRGEEYLPGADITSDEDIKEFVRNNVVNIFHPVGTCKMGNDPMAVVNDRLQVHGIQGLRVADASIMPFIVNANTNAPCIMIGEKCAAMVLGED